MSERLITRASTTLNDLRSTTYLSRRIEKDLACWAAFHPDEGSIRCGQNALAIGLEGFNELGYEEFFATST